MARQATSTFDGLVVGYGTHTADDGVPAVTSEKGSVKTMVLEILGTSVPTAWAAANVSPQAATIPRGSIIHKSTFETVVPFTSGGAATLSIGTYGGAAFTTTDVVAGIDSAVAITAIDAIGETVQNDGTLVAGTISVGATADSACVIGYTYGTAAFTAGKGILTVQYSTPSGSSGGSIAS
jgi:hypothetical protein